MEMEYTMEHFFMQAALREAREAAEEGEIPIGAVVVCGDRIVGKGHNRVEALGDATAHAEMQALTAAMNSLGSKYLPECALYVTVEPCVMCAGALGWSQISRIVYGTPDDKRGFRRYAPHALHPKTEITEGVLTEECAALMRDFFTNRR